MNWFQKLFSSAGSTTANMPSLFSTGSKGVNTRKLLQSYTRWVYVCVDRIAQATADVPVNLKRRTADGVEDVEDHEALALLEKPNDIQTGRMLRYVMAAHTEIAGNAFVFIKDEDNIIPLIPDKVEIETGDDGFSISGYNLKKGADKEFIPKEEMLHYRYPNPTNIQDGLGVVEPIAKWVDVDTLMTDFNKKFFENGAWLGGIVESEATNEKQLELIKTGFENEHRGPRNSHRVGVLPSGATFKEQGKSQKDMEYQEGSRMFRDKILAAFGVPKTVLGIVEDVNRASAEASNFVFYDHTIKPKVRQYVDFLNEQYLELFDDDDLFFEFEDPTPENKEIKIQEYKAALGGQSWMTINEVREAEGKERVENGDEIIRPNTMAVVGESEESQPSNPPRHFRQYQKNKTTQKDDFKDVAKEIVGMEREQELEQRHKQFEGRVDPVQRDVEQALNEQADELQVEVINNIRMKIRAVDKADIFNKDEAVQATIDVVTPILEQLGEEEGRIAMQNLASVAEQFNPADEDYQEALTNSIDKMADSYHEETLDKLQDSLNEGILEGEPENDLIDRVNNEFEKIERYRAERVARSETFRTANRARLSAYRQSGVVKEIRWYTALDSRVCAFCNSMNGEVVSTQEKFFRQGEEISVADDEGEMQTMQLNYTDIENPPLHANCRCYIVPETISVRSEESEEAFFDELIDILEYEE